MPVCPKCRTPFAAAKASRCPKCGAGLAPGSGRPVPPERKPRTKSLLYIGLAGVVCLIFVVVLIVMVATGKKETDRLVQKADELLKTERRLQAGPPKRSSKARTHRDESLGYEIAIPEGWEAEPTRETPVVLRMMKPGAAGTEFALIVQELPSDASPSTYPWDKRFEAIVQSERTSGDEVEVIGKREETCCGNRAYLGTYATRNKELSTVALLYMTAARNRTFILTWHAPSKLYPSLAAEFERVSKDFKLLDPADAARPARPTPIEPAPRKDPLAVQKPPEAAPDKPMKKESEPTRLPEGMASVYEDKTSRFTIPVPKGWKTETKPKAHAFAVILTMTEEKDPFSRLSVTVPPPLPKEGLPRGLVDYMPAVQGLMRRDYDGVRILEQKEGICSGYPALRVLWAHRSRDNRELNTIAYYVNAPGSLYQIQCTCPPADYARLKGVIDRCFDGFRVTEK